MIAINVSFKINKEKAVNSDAPEMSSSSVINLNNTMGIWNF